MEGLWLKPLEKKNGDRLGPVPQRGRPQVKIINNDPGERKPAFGAPRIFFLFFCFWGGGRRKRQNIKNPGFIVTETPIQRRQ